MRTAKFTTVVKSRDEDNTAPTAIANCSAYLAYADQTDTFGYYGVVDSVSMENGNVVFKWQAPVSREHQLNQVEEEMNILSRVVSHECTTNPLNRNV